MEQIKCSSLEEVRQHIDKIDSELIQLIAKRSTYVNQAAQFKKSVNEVKASDRVTAIIEKVRVLSEQYNLNPLIAEKIYRTMINSFIEQEITEFDPLYKDIKQSYY